MTPRALDSVDGAHAGPTMTVVEVTVDGAAFWVFYNDHDGQWLGQYKRESQSVRVLVADVPADVLTEDTVTGRVLTAAKADRVTVLVLKWR